MAAGHAGKSQAACACSLLGVSESTSWHLNCPSKPAGTAATLVFYDIGKACPPGWAEHPLRTSGSEIKRRKATSWREMIKGPKQLPATSKSVRSLLRFGICRVQAAWKHKCVANHCRMNNQHANATERRGHLGLKRRKSCERSAVFTSGC